MIPVEVEPQSKRRKIGPVSEISSSSTFTNCGHSFVRYGICCTCRATVAGDEGRRPFGYLVDGMQLSERAVKFTKKLSTQVTGLIDKKLHLVLDLDHTLLHTVMVSNLSEGEKYLIGEVDSREDLRRFYGGSSEFLVKLRPFLHEFLKEVNEMFNLYVYTMGNRAYARHILKLIDPERVYFGKRVITENESPFRKTLDLVLADESGIVIVDDTPEVWPDHKRNLIEITKYNYFNDVEYSRSYAEEKTDETDHEEGSLASILKLLKEIHQGFFSCEVGKNLDFDSKDVRLLLHSNLGC